MRDRSPYSAGNRSPDSGRPTGHLIGGRTRLPLATAVAAHVADARDQPPPLRRPRPAARQAVTDRPSVPRHRMLRMSAIPRGRPPIATRVADAEAAQIREAMRQKRPMGPRICARAAGVAQDLGWSRRVPMRLYLPQ